MDIHFHILSHVLLLLKNEKNVLNYK